MSSNLYRLAIAAATATLLAGASQADAKAHRLVVCDFDGPRSFADAGRTAVMSLLGDQYDIVSSKRWEQALSQARGHGSQQQWAAASKSTGVDGVIMGNIEEEGRHHTLTVEVRDAATGNEIDGYTVRLGDKGLSDKDNRELAAQLDDMLSWLDGDATAREVHSTLPPVSVAGSIQKNDHGHAGRDDGDDSADEGGDDDGDYHRGSMRMRGRRHGTHHSRRYARRDTSDRDDRDDDSDSDYPPPRHRRGGDSVSSPRLGGSGDDQGDTTAAPSSAIPAPAPAPGAAPAATLPTLDVKTEGAAAVGDTKDTSDLVKVFSTDSAEVDVVAPKLHHTPKPTPRFMVSGGAFIASRGMNFDYDPGTDSPPPQYPSSGIKGVQVNAAVYPSPIRKIDGDLSGIGFTLGVSKAVGSSLTAMDDTGYGDYTIDHTAWELGVHYRYPFGDMITIDGELSYGNISTSIVDLPESIELPDTSYSYLGAGLHLDLNITDHATVGFGGKYMYMLSTGDVSSEDWYGAGTAYGYSLDANFMIPLPASLFLRGKLEYRTEHMDFEGSGAVTMAHAVWSMDDNSISGSVDVGIKF